MEDFEREFVEAVNARRLGTAVGALDIVVVEATRERLVATMPVGPSHRQPDGYLHGGISVVLAETVASLGSSFHVDGERQMVFGLEINANHVRSKRDGVVTAIGTPLHLGRATHVWDVRIVDEQGKLVCVSRCTVAVVDRPVEG